METYEIRLVTRDYQTSGVVHIMQASDFAAIRRARATPLGDGGIEVWRGLDCIYANYRQQEHAAAC
jgi:hypothetical protein